MDFILPNFCLTVPGTEGDIKFAAKKELEQAQTILNKFDKASDKQIIMSELNLRFEQHAENPAKQLAILHAFHDSGLAEKTKAHRHFQASKEDSWLYSKFMGVLNLLCNSRNTTSYNEVSKKYKITSLKHLDGNLKNGSTTIENAAQSPAMVNLGEHRSLFGRFWGGHTKAQEVGKEVVEYYKERFCQS